jgi:hypothetical protein
MTIENLGDTLLLLFGLICVLPLVITLIAAFVLWRTGQRWIERALDPDVERLSERFAALRSAEPDAPDQRLIGRIIHRQALRCGVVGAVTGLGGFYTLPIALPIDIALSLRIQAGMVGFIAAHYNHAAQTPVETRVRDALIMTGSSQAAERATGYLVSFAVRVMGKSLSKLVPFIGAAIGFAVNYAIARAMGWAAVRWYAARSDPS